MEPFHRLCETVPERRLEQIGGELLDGIAKATRRVESPLRPGECDEPEPDLALVQQRADGYLDAHPGPADTVLVLEVAESSLPFDLETKARLYVTAGISWYWVIDVAVPHLIPVARGPAPAPLLEALWVEVEALLATIPPATPGGAMRA